MVLAVEIVVWSLMLAGVFFAVVGGIGLLRLPDLFSRMHGAGMTDTLGAGLILAGLLVHSLAGTALLAKAEENGGTPSDHAAVVESVGEHAEDSAHATGSPHSVMLNQVSVRKGSGLVAFKILAILVFLLITSPTATHALSRAALHSDVRPWTADGEDSSSNG